MYRMPVLLGHVALNLWHSLINHELWTDADEAKLYPKELKAQIKI